MAIGVGVGAAINSPKANPVYAADSGLSASDGVFVIDFYDSTKLSSTSGTGLSNSNYSNFVKVNNGLTKTNVVTGVSVTGTVQYGKNGGLTAGTGTAAASTSHYVTFSIGSDYAVNKCTVYATEYEAGRWMLNDDAADSGSLGAKGATFASVSSPLVWDNLGGLTALTFKKDNGSGGNQKRLTIYTIVCEYSTSGGGQTPTTYSVTYANGGATSGSVPVDNTEYESGDTVIVLGNSGNLAKDNYTFNGWTNGITNYDEDDTFEITSNVTLTAVWSLEDGVDLLTKTFTGSPSSYTDWSNKVGASGAVYSGNSNGGNDSIQLRDNTNSGIVSTTSGGNVKKVSVDWHSETAAGRTLNIYGKNTPYSASSDLYNASSRGTLLGTIVKGTSTSLSINSDYRYIGLCSNSGAMYLTSITIKWEAIPVVPSVTLNPSALTLKTNQTEGAVVTAYVENVDNPTYSWVANDANVSLDNEDTAAVTIYPEINTNGSSSVTLTVGGVNPALTVTLDITISVPGPGETAGTAYSVAEAKTAIGNASGDLENVYITGIISQIDQYYSSSHSINYWISDDGTTTNQFKIYGGKGLNGADFNAIDELYVGDAVVLFGTISKQYSNLNSGNSIISLVPAPRVNSISLTPSNIKVDLNGLGNITDLFTNITINQDAGSTKTVNDIEWSSDDDNVLYLDNGQYLAGNVHRASTVIRASINGREYGSATVTVVDPSIPAIPYDNQIEWTLVSDISTLVAGDQVILVGEKDEVTYAAGTYSSGNNVPADTVNTLTVSGNKVTGVVNTMIYTLEAGSESGSLAFKDSAGKYLYAAGGTGSNHLKTQDSIDGNASFVLNSDGTVVAQGASTRNYMRYNNTSTYNLFACYGSTSTTGDLVTFYKRSGGSGEIDLTSVAPTATLHATETEPGIVSNVYIEFGAKISIEQWNAIEDVANVTDYGVMLFRTRKALSSNKPVQDAIDGGKTPTVISKGSGDVPSDPEGGYYSFTVRVNVSSASNYDIMFCAAPFIEVNGTRYILSEVQYSVNTLADYYVTNSIPTDLSEDALLALMA